MYHPHEAHELGELERLVAVVDELVDLDVRVGIKRQTCAVSSICFTCF